MVSRSSPLPFKLSPEYPFPLSEQFLPWLEAFAETILPNHLLLFSNTLARCPSLSHPQLLFSTSFYFLGSLTYFPLPLPPWPVGSTWHGRISQSKQRFSISGHCTVRITHSPSHSLRCEGQLGFLAGGVLPPHASLPRG